MYSQLIPVTKTIAVSPLMKWAKIPKTIQKVLIASEAAGRFTPRVIVYFQSAGPQRVRIGDRTAQVLGECCWPQDDSTLIHIWCGGSTVKEIAETVGHELGHADHMTRFPESKTWNHQAVETYADIFMAKVS